MDHDPRGGKVVVTSKRLYSIILVEYNYSMTNSNIGTADDAMTAYLIHEYCVQDEYMHTEPTEVASGWTFLGSGVHRFVYQSPSGVVYKVPAYAGGGCAQANVTEATAAAILSQSPAPEGFAVPEVNLFDVDGCPIVAMPNYGGQDEYVYDHERDTARSFFRNNDVHSGNMRRFGGRLVMIDLGFFHEDTNGQSASCSCCV